MPTHSVRFMCSCPQDAKASRFCAREVGRIRKDYSFARRRYTIYRVRLVRFLRLDCRIAEIIERNNAFTVFDDLKMAAMSAQARRQWHFQTFWRRTDSASTCGSRTDILNATLAV